MIIALLGNPNSGKTTLFNQLTGSNQHVGNFPGVTVEKKEGAIRGQKNMTLVDLPGIYSLSPYTAEEVVTRDFLLVNKPEAVINIVDATNIERNLYLTLQLMEVGVPVVVALNMMDEVRQNGDSIDVPLLSQNLGLPIVPISAAKNEGCEELVQRTIEAAQQKDRPRGLDLCQGEVHRAVHSIAHIIEKEVKDAGLPSRYAATKVVEGDPITLSKLNLTDSEKEIIDNIVREMETNLGTDREAALADMRYDFIANACKDAVKKNGNARELQRSIQIDRVLTHKYFGIPIFLCVMLLTFFLTFNVIGAVLSDWLSLGIDGLTGLLDQALANLGINAAVHSLLIDGVCVGVGSVLSFLPTIVTLFFFLSILEDSGYMARVAFVMDKLLRKIGLSGRSFVPMLIGFGCSVPAIMATRTLASERDRRMTILLTPFMSCSAKLPIYATFTAAFFPNAAPLVMIGLYVGGMVVGVLYGLLLKHTIFKGKPVPFVMELPAYRLPSAKSVVIHMWEKAKDFLVKAFTIIFMASIVIWVLQSFDTRLMMVSDSSDSMLAGIGRFIAPVFAPLGFGNWISSTALLTGLSAKEAVVSTLAVLTNVPDTAQLSTVLGSLFTPLSAVSFLTFTLLYMPCFAAVAAVKRELGSARYAALAMFAQCCVAWIVAFLVYQIGGLILGV